MKTPWPGTKESDAIISVALQASLWTLISLLSSPPYLIPSSPILQGRPLREQQELAAAVIQRCYKRYKQVGRDTQNYVCVHFWLVIIKGFTRMASIPSSLFPKLTWIALKVTLLLHLQLLVVWTESLLVVPYHFYYCLYLGLCIWTKLVLTKMDVSLNNAAC